MRTFDFFGHKLPYLQQGEPHPEDSCKERTIERPIADLWLSKIDPTWVIEVGDTTPMLWCGDRFKEGVTEPVKHTVIDPWGPYPGNVRRDAESCSFKGMYVLSISTLEHVGMLNHGNTEYDPTKGIRLLKKITYESMGFLISWAIGENPLLDGGAALWLDSKPEYGFMFKRINEHNDWEMAPIDWTMQYGSPYPCGNGVIFITDSLEWAKNG